MASAAHVFVLFGAMALALWVAFTAFARRSVPGHLWLGWLQIAIALWAGTSGLHALLSSTPQRIVVSEFQYFGIMAVPVCWLEFARAYTRRPPSAATWLIFVVPAITVAMAFSNDSHHLLWRDIVEVQAAGGIRLQYVHGPWFAVATAFVYLALATGTVWLYLAVRTQPEQYRLQSFLITSALTVPWIANLMYLSGVIPPGFDPTPLGFAASGAFFAVGLFRYELFDLVPVARTVLFDSLGDAVFVIDRQGRVVDSNATAVDLVGGAATLGRPIADVLPWWQSRPRRGATDEVVHANGRAFDVQMRPVLDQSRELSAWLVVVRDVTERERTEAQRRALDVRLLEQQRVESLTLLAGGLAHDFRSLLQGIIGNAELADVQLARTPEFASVHESLHAINQAAERASELVARMQDYAGRRPDARQPVDLSALTGDMVTLLQNSTARHARLLLELPSTPVIALGDATQLRQILLNLVNNAAEAARDAGMEGSIHIRLSSVPASAADLQTASFDGTRGGAAPDGTFAVLDVVDTGPGIDPRALSRVFDPYFSTKASGRGLGLSAVLGIVRGHQGAIRIQSEIGQGTSVRVWIPGVTTT
jgi:signal transduction histidine kinase